jgi:hypothetical protein
MALATFVPVGMTSLNEVRDAFFWLTGVVGEAFTVPEGCDRLGDTGTFLGEAGLP